MVMNCKSGILCEITKIYTLNLSELILKFYKADGEKELRNLFLNAKNATCNKLINCKKNY